MSFILFGLLDISGDRRRSFLEGPIPSDGGIPSTGMAEGAAGTTPVTEVESFSRTLARVTLVSTIIKIRNNCC